MAERVTGGCQCGVVRYSAEIENDDAYRFEPKGRFAKESWHEEWLDTSGLPAKRTEDNERLVERWMKTIGKLPD